MINLTWFFCFCAFLWLVVAQFIFSPFLAENLGSKIGKPVSGLQLPPTNLRRGYDAILLLKQLRDWTDKPWHNILAGKCVFTRKRLDICFRTIHRHRL